MLSMPSISVAGLTLSFLAAAVRGHPFHPPKPCPPVRGTFTIDLFKLYSESSDWDPINCKYYAGSLFNATVAVYDPYTKESQILTSPGISHTDPYQISGVSFDAHTGSMFFTANSGIGFLSNGQDLSGPNKIIRWDVRKQEVVYIADLGPFQQEFQNLYGHGIAGFEYAAADRYGNAYVAAGYGGNGIAKVWNNGSVSALYYAEKDTDPTLGRFTYTNLASIPLHDKIIVNDHQLGTFVTFNTSASWSTPTIIKVSNMPSTYNRTGCDSLTTPTRYHGQQIMLCAVDRLGGSGAVTVFQSLDNWQSAKYLGVVYNTSPLAQQGVIVVNALQLSNSIYYVPFFVSDSGNLALELKEGNRTAFPIIDITTEVDSIVKAARY
ncbi:hypothetical protein BKA56DRAFT_682257 [Ilyonectria sp. MPI-CAGE-AT-0026]|nr:hypothetical protein BKA56DRAFT_682257 [Ilyonectria sp. MPI-CAGE-AT-0026]